MPVRFVAAAMTKVGFVLLLAAFSVLALGPALVMTGDAVAAQGDAGPLPVELAPDVALLVTGLEDDQPNRLTTRLNNISGVARATADGLEDGSTAFHLALDEVGGPGRSIEAVARDAEAEIAALAPEAQVLIGGTDLVDRELARGFRTSARWLAALGLVLGAAIGAVFGTKRMILTAAALPLAVLCAASLGAQIGGPFDGTIAATAVPGALAGLLAGVAVALRLLLWFRSPSGPDGAEVMRRSVVDLLPELALVLSGLAVTAVIIEFLNPGRSPLTILTIGAFLGVLVVLAIMAPGLTLLDEADRGGPPAMDRLLPLTFPDGRDFPLLLVLGVAAVMLALSVFAFGQTARTLIGAEALDQDDEAAMVAATLAANGGDPTDALVVLRPQGVSTTDFEGWAGVAVERSDVAWIDTGSGRITALGPAEVDEIALLVPPGRSDVAVIVPAEGSRSDEGQQLASRLAAIPLAGGPPDFVGEASETERLVGSRTTLLLALGLLAAVAAGALYVMTQNVALAVVAFVLRLLSGGAALGVLRLMDSEVTAAEALTVLGLLSIALGLFELEFLRRLTEHSLGSPSGGSLRSRQIASFGQDGGDPVAPNPGQNAGLALVALGIGGLVLSWSALFGGGHGIGQLGLAILAVVIIEVLLGLVVLRPALLGQRAAFHTAVRPVRIALHSGVDRQSQVESGPEDPAWRRTVGDLLQAEFRLQSEPVGAELEQVFVPDTPLYRQAVSHHQNLGKANLRIVGRSPQLRTLKTVSGRAPVSLAVTVDHPTRHLVDEEGTVVGVRRPERRSGVLWLSLNDDGSYRIAESVELGSVPLPEDDDGEHDEPDDTGELDVVDHRSDAVPADDGVTPDSEHLAP